MLNIKKWLDEQINQVEQNQNAPLDSIFTPEFMRLHTEYANFDDFWQDYCEQFDNQGISLLEFTQESTFFDTWEDMLVTAYEKTFFSKV